MQPRSQDISLWNWEGGGGGWGEGGEGVLLRDQPIFPAPPNLLGKSPGNEVG